mmetsp:Transcript_6977/g.14420  ORF Transcript_6977/g.14420 Transcript_6977/m.14420 type:complete len:208 (+) Transcript_6977:620-1243(+)
MTTCSSTGSVQSLTSRCARRFSPGQDDRGAIHGEGEGRAQTECARALPPRARLWSTVRGDEGCRRRSRGRRWCRRAAGPGSGGARRRLRRYHGRTDTRPTAAAAASGPTTTAAHASATSTPNRSGCGRRSRHHDITAAATAATAGSSRHRWHKWAQAWPQRRSRRGLDSCYRYQVCRGSGVHGSTARRSCWAAARARKAAPPGFTSP